MYLKGKRWEKGREVEKQKQGVLGMKWREREGEKEREKKGEKEKRDG